MTLVVGFHCQDGVLLASDSMITNSMGQIGTTETKGQKVYEVDGQQIFAFAGNSATAQRYRIMLGLVHRGQQTAAIPLDYATVVSTSVQGQLAQTNHPIPTGTNSLIGFTHDGEHQLLFLAADLQYSFLNPSEFWFAIGSGKQWADPFLKFLTGVFCANGQPTLNEARFLATWVLEHVIETNTGGVNGPIQMAELFYENGAPQTRMVAEEEIEEHRDAIADATDALIIWREALVGEGEAGEDAPAPPAPDGGATGA